MQFTLRQIELFVAVCESGSISAAATDQHIAQSAVSTAIRNLEAALEVTLFVRNHAAGVHPTPEGRELLQRARYLLTVAQSIEQFGAEQATKISGPIHIGFLVTIAPIVMATLIRQFEQDHPDARLVCREGDQAQLVEWLHRGEIGLAVTYDIAVPDDLSFWPIARIPPRILLDVGNPLVERSSVRLEELVDHPFILLDLPGSTEYFLGLFTAESLVPRIAYRSRNIDVVRSLVSEGIGYSIVNLHAAGTFSQTKTIPTVAIAGDHAILSLGTMIQAGTRPSAALLAVQDQVVEWAERSGYCHDGNDNGES